MIKKPLISVVIPAYNVGKYISKTIESVTRQDIGFVQNIELILVNDGSTDNTAEICKAYKGQFPQNVIYIAQENAGVSAARNAGMGRARGAYIHFLDGDDVISRNFYRKSVRLFISTSEPINFVASKIVFFDGVYKPSHFAYNFNSDKVVDIDKEPDKSIFHVSSALIRRSAVQELIFDERLKYGEDAKFLNQLLYITKKYGTVSGTKLYYRKRSNESSAINRKLHDRAYFISSPQLFLTELAWLWSDAGGSVHPYMQHLLINDIAWKLIEEKSQEVLSEEEEARYKEEIYALIRRVDKQIILKNRLLSIDQKLFLIKKQNPQYAPEISLENGHRLLDGLRGVIADTIVMTLDFIHSNIPGKLRIEGYVQLDMSHLGEYYLQTKNGNYLLNRVDRRELSQGFLGDDLTQSRAFEVDVDIDDVDSITAKFVLTSGGDLPVQIQTNQFTGLGPLNRTYQQRGSILLLKKIGYIKVLRNTLPNRVIQETMFSIRMLGHVELRRSIAWLKSNIVNISSMRLFMSRRDLLREFAGPFGLLLRSVVMNLWDVIFRRLYFSRLYASKKPIWLLSDRGLVAGDNGEALFKYVVENEQPPADIYFIISKKTSDYERLKKIGKVVDINSFKYKMLFLRAEKIISSSADYYAYNAFGYRWAHFNDLYNFDFIFLQHGVIKDDLSRWLNRFEKNIKLFVTSAKLEYDSIVQGAYYYSKRKVVLSGLPRFDLLCNNPRKILMLAPTWRQHLLPEERHGTSGIRAYSDHFKDTQYYEFYNSLMNDPRVTNALKKEGMQGRLYLHPAFSRQACDFTSNEVFTVCKMPYDYNKAFEESEVLVTDYSSVAFDFAYLQKPVVYTQFDKDSLYESHIYQKGYFSYENEGFGPVVYDYESAVGQIVCAISGRSSRRVEKYRQRAETFFYKIDKQNSKRVYEAILGQEGR